MLLAEIVLIDTILRIVRMVLIAPFTILSTRLDTALMGLLTIRMVTRRDASFGVSRRSWIRFRL